MLTLSDKGGVGELIGIKLQIACTGRCCTLYSVQYHLQRKYKCTAKKKYIRTKHTYTKKCNHCTHSIISKRAGSKEEHKYLVQNTNSSQHKQSSTHDTTCKCTRKLHCLVVGWFSVPTLGL